MEIDLVEISTSNWCGKWKGTFLVETCYTCHCSCMFTDPRVHSHLYLVVAQKCTRHVTIAITWNSDVKSPTVLLYSPPTKLQLSGLSAVSSKISEVTWNERAQNIKFNGRIRHRSIIINYNNNNIMYIDVNDSREI